MKEFRGFAALAEHLIAVAATREMTIHHGLKAAAEHVEKTAKEEVGHYQPETGPFPAWAELADSTKADRVAKGFTENDPLLRSGELRDGYQHEVIGDTAVIGSESDVALWMETGTEKAPPRPVLGAAAYNSREEVVNTVGRAAVQGLIGSMPDSK